MSTVEPVPGVSPVPVIVIEQAHGFPMWEFLLVTVPTVALAIATVHADHEAMQLARLVVMRLLPPYRKPQPVTEPDDGNTPL